MFHISWLVDENMTFSVIALGVLNPKQYNIYMGFCISSNLK